MAFGMCEWRGCPDCSTRRPVVQVTARPPHNCVAQKPQARPKGDHLFDQGIDGATRYVVEYEVAVEFCDHHAGLWQWKKFVDEACWSAIENQLRQIDMAPPSKDDVTVRWVDAAGEDGLNEQGRMLKDYLHGELAFQKDQRELLTRE